MQIQVINAKQHYTPEAEQLLPYFKYKCGQCNSTFVNIGNYEMHLKRHHKLPPAAPSMHNDKDTTRLFHCPTEDCIYHVARYPHGKHFKNMKYLRQHFQKVHAERRHTCERCGKRFASQVQLLVHAEQVCGRRFVCSECGWDYESREALQTHVKRKGHVQQVMIKKEEEVVVENKIPENSKTNANEIDLNLSVFKNEPQAEVQINEPCTAKRLRTACNASAQTDLPATSTTTESAGVSSIFLDDIHSLLRDIETQTELPPLRISPTSNAASSSSGGGFLDQMLAAHAQSTHMHTQTACDDFLSELGLADIQTQTNWEYATTGTSTGYYAHDELLVSTETQTSFTQCLLDSAEETGGGFGSLTTQHTQTCDTLLEGLFGAQEQDLISGFQSTYTQT